MIELKQRKILCIDLKSFFASVECRDLNLDPFKTPLVVADLKYGKSGITLAITPYLKNKGINSRSRLYQLPKNINIIYAKPRHSRYVEVSREILNIYLEYVSEKDLDAYSIDEVFLDVTNYLKYYEKDEINLAKNIQSEILRRTKISSSVGISSSKLLAKYALDLAAKNSKDGIAVWDQEDIYDKLWKIKDLTRVWGIGPATAKKLYSLGIHNVEQLAKANKTFVEKYLGVYGAKLVENANGRETDYQRNSKTNESIGHSHVTNRDIYATEAKNLMLDIVDKIARRLRRKKLKTKVVRIAINYSKSTSNNGFSKQCTTEYYIDNPKQIYEICLKFFDAFYDLSPIRKVSITAGKLKYFKETQIDLFGNQEKIDKEDNLLKAVDKIQRQFGKNKIKRASREIKSELRKK